MEYKLYCYFDRVAGAYGAPFISINDDTAKRQMAVEMSKSNPLICQDYELYCVGTFSNDFGIVVGLDKPQFICKFQDLSGVTSNE